MAAKRHAIIAHSLFLLKVSAGALIVFPVNQPSGHSDW
jgi:hypothetical protein